ncbi:zinc-binding alcohol dehydrogenase family protein [Nocardia sp. NPDC050710]|uniref:zinc-binding alcohol dehydrogenase family protein n=1 Tax=Nocardia sp. NPDC050710 TaxID=3157220 RepID=UPI00340F33A1
MTAWRVRRPGPIDDAPLDVVRESVPEPGVGELLVRVSACGVCRTDLHVAEGDLPVHRVGVVPGHEVVGEVVAVGPGVPGRDGPVDTPTAAGPHDTGGADSAVGRGASGPDRGGVPQPGFAIGDKVGIAWLRHTCGVCRYCVRGAENLCPNSAYTGWDADGGYAEFTTVPADYALRLPAGYADVETAPLLCAGIIGYRALQRASVPPGGRLGIYGFGGSAHIAAQVALARGAEVHVMTRDPAARELARELGAASVQGAADSPPVPLDSAIMFAPVGELVPPALAALDRGGVLAIAGIHLSDIPVLNYQRHLFQEREIRSVTANTRADAREFLDFAGEQRITVTARGYSLDSADRALADLAHGRFAGAAVLVP